MVDDACADELVAKFNVDRATALRFSKARDGNLKKAEPFLASDLAWRQETRPEAIEQADVMKVIESGTWRLLGKTEPDGFAVLFCSLAYWDPTQYDTETYTRFVIYFIERMTRIGERFVVLLNFSGWKLWHGFHLRKIYALISTLQDHYPERLEAAILMRVPGIFQATWAVAKTFFDPNTAKKIFFVGSGAEAEKVAISERGAWGVWPACYGGPNQEPVPCPNVPGESNVADAPMLTG